MGARTAHLVYDTGALIAADRGDPRMLVLHSAAVERDVQPTVPAVVLAQAWRGGSHPRMSRLLQGCVIVPDDEVVARAAGALCAAAGTSDVVDAIVVVTARSVDADLVTSDPGDVLRLTDQLRWSPGVFVV